MSSDELKVPSQRHDLTDDETDKDREREAAQRNELADDDEFARSEADTEVRSSETADGTPLPGGDRRVDDEYPAATPVANTPVANDEDDTPLRDPYARAGGDMLAPEPEQVEPQESDPAPPAHAAPDETVLFDQDPAEVQARWRDLQAAFVDDPGEAVQRADGLVGEVVDALTSALSNRTNALRDRWKDTESADTEQLRLALRDYRNVLERLLTISGTSPSQPTPYQSQGMR